MTRCDTSWGWATRLGVLDAVAMGADLFDCVWPTRLARHGKILTPDGDYHLKAARFATDPGPLHSECGCSTCGVHSRAYLRHLHVTGELLAHSLLTVHNLHYTLELIAATRLAIEERRFDEHRADGGGQATFTAPDPPSNLSPGPPSVGRTHVIHPRSCAGVGTDPEKEGGTMILAQEAAAGGGSPLGLILPLVLFVGIFYFLILRPQRQRMKQQQNLMSSIGLGDEVRTIGGIIGRIVSMDDENVVLEVEEGRMKVARRAIASKTTPPEPPPTPPESDI